VAGALQHGVAEDRRPYGQASDGVILHTAGGEPPAAAMELLGVDFARLQDAAGHA